MIDVEATYALILDFFVVNQIAIFFSLGSILIYFLIIFVDKLIQNKSKKKSVNFTSDQSISEVDKGISSLDQALHDKIINEEEYEKFKSDLMNKEQK